MPRKRLPPSLRSSSLHALAKLTLDSCKNSDGKHQEVIQQYVQDIPGIFANEYVDEILKTGWKWRECFDRISAFHPLCTAISEESADGFFTSPAQVFRGLQVMRDLISIKPIIELWFSSEVDWQGILLPKMTDLQSIKVALGTNRQVLPHILENCPSLENFTIYDPLEIGMTRSILLSFTNYTQLRQVFFPSCWHVAPEVTLHLLDHLPNLDVLQLRSDSILKVLPLCKRAYKLKDFIAELHVHDAASVQQVVTHFPYLERLTLYMRGKAPINQISELANLKSFSISNGTSSNLLFLMDKCMFGLHQLHLHSITDLDSLFRQNMNVSYQNLESLTISECTGVNVAVVMEIFPNLEFVKLLDGKYMANSVPREMPRAASQALEHLEMTNVPVKQIKCLIPFCSKLKSLKVYNVSVNSGTCELLCNANLRELRTLYVKDNSMNREVIPIILDSCGEYLERVDLHSDKLIFSPDYVVELSHRTEKYDMQFYINHCTRI